MPINYATSSHTHKAENAKYLNTKQCMYIFVGFECFTEETVHFEAISFSIIISVKLYVTVQQIIFIIKITVISLFIILI